MTRVRIGLPAHLRTLARVGPEVEVALAGPLTIEGALDALENGYPMLGGTIRDHGTRIRRPFIRYFACGEDLSHEPTDSRLPEAVRSGDEPLLIIGAISGG